MFKCSIAELSLALLTATPFLAQMGTSSTEGKIIAPAPTRQTARPAGNQGQQHK